MELQGLQNGNNRTVGAGATSTGSASATLTWGLNETDDWAVGAISIRPSVVQCGAGTLNAVGLRISDGSDSQISTTTEALAIHAAWLSAGSPSVGPVGSTYNVAASGLSNVSRIDFGGDTNAFAGTLPYPGIGTVGDESFSDFLVHSSGTLSLAAGNYTIFVESDDGFSLVMDTVFGGTVSFNKFGGSAAGASNELRFEGATSNARTGGSFTLTQDSVFDITAIFFERGGQDYMEVSIANGLLISETPADYEILRDGALNDKVKFGQCAPPTPLLEYRFEEPLWNGTSGEVIDETGTFNAQAINGPLPTSQTPAIAGNPGTCRYGSFDGVNDYIALPSSFENLQDSFTVTAWINASGGGRIFADDENNTQGYALSLGDNGTGRLRFYSRGVSPVSVDTTAAITPNTWTFVAAVHNSVTKTREIYINGIAQTVSGGGTSNTYTGTWGIDSGPASIGGETDSGETSSRFTGDIDEVQLYKSALNASQLQTIMNETHPCSDVSVDHFTVGYNINGIHCVAETVLVTARNADDTVTTGYTGTITLDTQTAKGTWSLEAGAAGVFNDATDNDGLATYTFAAADNGEATFSLLYTEGTPTFNIDTYDGAIRDDASDSNITFANTGFTVTASPLSDPFTGLINDPIGTQIAGTDFPLHLAVYGTTATDLQCGVIETYTGSKSLTLSTTYVNPGTTGGISATGGGSTTFSNGRAQITVEYKDAGRIRLDVSDGTLNGGTLTGGFVVKPDRFDITLSACTLKDCSDTAADHTESAYAVAGVGFTVTVTAKYANGDTTPNFGLESSPSTILTLNAQRALPNPGNDGNFTGSLSKSINPGEFSGTFSWSEVGTIDLIASIVDYLGPTDADVTSTLSDVGRFIPAYFSITSPQNGEFENAQDLIDGDYTYIGQSFSYGATRPAFTLNALNDFDNITQNYSGDWAKLIDSDILFTQPNSDRVKLGSTSVLMPVVYTKHSTSLAVPSGNGVFNFTFSTNDSFIYTRDANSQVTPFAPTIDLIITSITDSDLVTTGVVTTLTPAALNTEMRFGRLRMSNVHGSELTTLLMPMQVEIFNLAGAFQLHTDDITTQVVDANLALLSDDQLSTTGASTLTVANPTALEGALDVNLSPPGAGIDGYIDVTPDLSIAGANLEWLRYDWSTGAGTFNENPTGSATFGIYKGNRFQIYIQQTYQQ
jgi:MSHA biogenesis protein MshQ